MSSIIDHAVAYQNALRKALEEWKTARAAACEVGVQHAEYIARLARLANAEDALQKLA